MSSAEASTGFCVNRALEGIAMWRALRATIASSAVGFRARAEAVMQKRNSHSCDTLGIRAESWTDAIIRTERFRAGRCGPHPLNIPQGYERRNLVIAAAVARCSHSSQLWLFRFCMTASARARNRPRWRRWSLAKRATWRSLRVRG